MQVKLFFSFIIIYYHTFRRLIFTEDIECFADGECTQSLFIGQWPAADAQECLEICRDEDECTFFTYYGQDDDICMGLANCVVLDDKTCTDCYSGNSTCPGNYIF